MADGTITIDIEASNADANAKIDETRRKSEELDESAKGSGKGAFSQLLDGIKTSEGALSLLQGAVAGFSLDAVVGGVSDLSAHAAEVNSYMATLESSAQRNSVSAQAMGSTYSTLVGVLADTDRAVETSGNAFALCGDNQSQLEGLTTSLIGAYSQFKANLPIESLAEAANETSKVGTVTGSMADALNWVSASTEQWNAALSGNPAAMAAFNAGVDAGLSKEDAFNLALAECTTEQERQQLVLSTLNALYGEAGAQYQDANADMIAYNQSQDAMSQSLADLGERVMPLAVGATEALTAVIGFIADNANVCLPVIGALSAAFIALNTAGMLAGVGVNLASAPLLPIIAVIALVVAAVVALGMNFEEFGALAQSVWQGVCDFVGGVVSTLGTFFTQTVPNALSDMVGWFSRLPGEVGEFLGNLLSDAAAWAGSMASRALEAGSKFLSNVVNFITQLPGRVSSFLGSVLSSALSFAGSMAARAQDAGSRFLSGVVNFITQLPGRVASFLGSVVSRVGSFAGEMASGAARAGQQFLSNIVSTLSSIPGRVASIGGDIVRGIARGISGAIGTIGDTLLGGIQNAIAGAKSFLGIASPSKLMAKVIGRWMPAGVAVGIEKNAGVVSEAMDDAVAWSPDREMSSARRVSPVRELINQTINFNQPVRTPDETARAMRMYGRYGLAAEV